MSVLEDTGVPMSPGPGAEKPPGAEIVPALSFKQQLSQRRKELENAASFELEIPGYKDFWARYRPLGYEEVRAIGLRVEQETADQAAGERLVAAETLAEACVDLLHLKSVDDESKPIFEQLGYRWSWEAGRDLFDLSVPEGTYARDVVTMVFPYPRDMLMMRHFQDFLAESMGFLPEIEEILMGESRGRSDGTSSRS